LRLIDFCITQLKAQGPSRTCNESKEEAEGSPSRRAHNSIATAPLPEREFFIDNLLVRIHFIIVMIGWTGLAPWKFEFPFPGSLTSTFLEPLPHPITLKERFLERGAVKEIDRTI